VELSHLKEDSEKLKSKIKAKARMSKDAVSDDSEEEQIKKKQGGHSSSGSDDEEESRDTIG